MEGWRRNGGVIQIDIRTQVETNLGRPNEAQAIDLWLCSVVLEETFLGGPVSLRWVSPIQFRIQRNPLVTDFGGPLCDSFVFLFYLAA